MYIELFASCKWKIAWKVNRVNIRNSSVLILVFLNKIQGGITHAGSHYMVDIMIYTMFCVLKYPLQGNSSIKKETKNI